MIMSQPLRHGRRWTLAALFVIALIPACESPPSAPELPVPVSFEVNFPQTPTALSTIAATFTNTVTSAAATITFSVVSGTSSRVWTGSGTLTVGSYTVDVQGRDENSNLLYRGSSSITVTAGMNTTFFLALVCVSTACEAATGAVSLVVFIPQLESEPNNTAATAQALTVFSYASGQLQYVVANGRIESADSADYFAATFAGLAVGDSIFVSVFADRFGSTLDATAALFSPSGTRVAYSDDVFGRDPMIAYPVPSAATSATYKFRVSGFGSSTGRYTVLAYSCRPGGAGNVVCRW